MNPNLIEGDVVLVNKLAYDIKIPFFGINIISLNNPARGDVVAFNKDGILFVKRVMALPGDTVQVVKNSFYVNGKKLNLMASKITALEENRLSYSKRFKFEAFKETNETSLSYNIIFATGLPEKLKESLVVNTVEYTIPEGGYFMIGDNRNLSNDSRYFGHIRRENIVGNVTITMFNYLEYFEKIRSYFKE
jgi:signal peptidase I